MIEDINLQTDLYLEVNEIVDRRTLTASAVSNNLPYKKKLVDLRLFLNNAPHDPNYR